MRFHIALMTVTLALLVGCTTGEKQAAGLLETARFEEKQNNFSHAVQLYDEIVRKHPSTSVAAVAAARSAELKRLNRP